MKAGFHVCRVKHSCEKRTLGALLQLLLLLAVSFLLLRIISLTKILNSSVSRCPNDTVDFTIQLSHLFTLTYSTSFIDFSVRCLVISLQNNKMRMKMDASSFFPDWSIHRSIRTTRSPCSPPLRSLLCVLGMMVLNGGDLDNSRRSTSSHHHHYMGVALAQDLPLRGGTLNETLDGSNLVPLIDVGQPVFTSQCHEEILQADLDGNMQLNQEEFVSFAQQKGPPGLIDHVTTFAELPASYQLAFTTLACLCSDSDYGGDDMNTDCCVGEEPYIRITDAPGSEQADADFLLLYATCSLTDAAARETLNSVQPTIAPELPTTPLPTPFPIAASPPPTSGPTTLWPTTAPSTLAPTSQPSLMPSTMAPTTVMPSTAQPSASPNVTPKPSTSFRPTPAPSTLQPTTTPTTVPDQAAVPTPSPPTAVSIATVQYEVVLPDGKQPNSEDLLSGYYSDVTVAMDLLSQKVAAEFFGGTTVSQELSTGVIGNSVRRHHHHRSLQTNSSDDITVQVQRPTSISEADDIGMLYIHLMLFAVSCFI
jgi:hypothetical protein